MLTSFAFTFHTTVKWSIVSSLFSFILYRTYSGNFCPFYTASLPRSSFHFGLHYPDWQTRALHPGWHHNKIWWETMYIILSTRVWAYTQVVKRCRMSVEYLFGRPSCNRLKFSVREISSRAFLINAFCFRRDKNGHKNRSARIFGKAIRTKVIGKWTKKP